MECKYCDRSSVKEYCRLRCAVLNEDYQYVKDNVKDEAYTYIAADCYSVKMLKIINASDDDIIDVLLSTSSTKQVDSIIEYYDNNYIYYLYGFIKNMNIIQYIVDRFTIDDPNNLLKKIAKHRDATTKTAIYVINKLVGLGGDYSHFTPKQMRKISMHS